MRILNGDVRTILPTLELESIHCCVTSPPYFGLRDYGCDGQIGLEKTPDEYVAEMVNVFREVRRVLRSDGTLWLNLGDSYAAHPGQRKASDIDNSPKQQSNLGSVRIGSRAGKTAPLRNVATSAERIPTFPARKPFERSQTSAISATCGPFPLRRTPPLTLRRSHLNLLSRAFWRAVRKVAWCSTRSEEAAQRRWWHVTLAAMRY